MEKHAFSSNDTPVPISSGPPSTVSSIISLSELAGRIVHVTVAIDVDHSWTSGLNITLTGPDGTAVLSVGGEGGSGNHFRFTIFDDRSTSSVRNAHPPYRGTFGPEEALASFIDGKPNGDWTLEIEEVEVFLAQKFFIEVSFVGGLSATQQQIFTAAA